VPLSRKSLDTVAAAPASMASGPAMAAPCEPAIGSALRMFRFERRWMVRVFEAMLPAGVDPRLTLGAEEVPLGRFVDEFLGRARLESVTGLRAGVWMIMLAPLFVLRRFRTFVGLDPAERREVLDRVSRSNIYLVRESAHFLKIIGCLAFCGLTTVQRQLGIYPLDAELPPWARRT
jgi:hypothetical protein